MKSDVRLLPRINGLPVTEIGDDAFNSCRLTSIVIPKYVKSIGKRAFHSSDIKSITIPSNVESIGEEAFSYCGSLTSAVIQDGAASIGDSLFYECRNLKSVRIPNGIESIGNGMFSWCDKLSSVTIPESVKSIGNSAFYWCKSLTSVKIPENVTSIGEKAFSYCTSLKSVTIPNNVSTIKNAAFSYCNNLESITIPDRITNIEDDTFRDCTSLTSVIIPNSVTNIGERAFLKCTLLKSVTISDNTKTIGDGAFSGCNSLELITIPVSVKSIGNSAFGSCTELTDVYYTGTEAQWNAIEIGTKALVASTANFEEVTMHYKGSAVGTVDENNRTTIDGVVYQLYDDYAAVSGRTDDIPSDVELLSEVNGLPVTEIESNALCHYDNVLPFPDVETKPSRKVTIIMPNTYVEFEHYDSVKSITIPDSVKIIGDNAFDSCDSLTSIIIPDGVTTIGNDAFSGCRDLRSVKIPDSVTAVGNYAFDNCYNLKSVIMSDGITNIGDGVFKNCANLTSITIPDGVASIGESAFGICQSLKNIYYTGTEAQWNAIDIDSTDFNSNLKNVTIHYNYKGEESLENYSLRFESPEILADEPETATFDNLIPNTVYNFYAFNDKNAEDLLSSENLLYVIQFTADENGNADIPYTPTDDQYLIAGTIYSITIADINISDADYTGSEIVQNPVVTWNGTELTEGVDYETDGDLSATESGRYVILIKGTGRFFGSRTVSYNIICEHDFSDGICTICGEEEIDYVPAETTTTATVTSVTSAITTTTSVTSDTTTETTAPEIILGDINGDGMVDASDASSVLAEYANLSTGGSGTFSDNQKSAGDVNSDGMIDANDASAILAFYSYLSTDGTEKDMRVWLDM